MRTIHGKIEGPDDIADEVVLHGMITGDVVVRSGGTLYLHGTCCQDVHVEAGGLLVVHGMIGRHLLNHGGEAHLHGIVSGQLIDPTNLTTIYDGARILDEHH